MKNLKKLFSFIKKNVLGYQKKFRSILEKEKDHRDPASQLFIAKSQVQQGLWGEARKNVKLF